MEPLAHQPPAKLLLINHKPIRAIAPPRSRPIPALDGHRLPARVVGVARAAERGEGVRTGVELQVRAVEEGARACRVDEDGVGEAGAGVPCFYCGWVRRMDEEGGEMGGGRGYVQAQPLYLVSPSVTVMWR